MQIGNSYMNKMQLVPFKISNPRIQEKSCTETDLHQIFEQHPTVLQAFQNLFHIVKLIEMQQILICNISTHVGTPKYFYFHKNHHIIIHFNLKQKQIFLENAATSIHAIVI